MTILIDLLKRPSGLMMKKTTGVSVQNVERKNDNLISPNSGVASRLTEALSPLQLTTKNTTSKGGQPKFSP
jgi:hypothetical protein